jgi:hypothetical protein
MRRITMLLIGCCLLAGPARGQLPQGGLPGGLSPAQALTLYQAMTPQQRQMLGASALRGKDTVSPTEALAWYQSMTPQQKQMAKEMVKQQAGGWAGLKEMAKQLLGK